MRKEVLVWILGLTMLTAGGCVTNGTYDSVVEQLTTIQRELRITQANGMVLTQLENSLESTNKNVQTDAKAASAALQQAKAEAEAERRVEEARIATLRRTLIQLVAQQRMLRQIVEDAKADTIALKKVIAVYKEKQGPLSETAATAGAPQGAPTPLSTNPTFSAPPQTGPTLAETATQSTAPVPPLPDKQPTQKAQPAGPTDESLLSVVMGWFISLWRSVFS